MVIIVRDELEDLTSHRSHRPNLAQKCIITDNNRDILDRPTHLRCYLHSLASK